MQILIYSLFLLILNTDGLQRSGIITHHFTVVPDALTALIVLGIIIKLTQQRTICMSPAYWALFAVIGLHLLFGVILNQVSTPTVVAGARNYLKYVPLFFVPAVFQFEPGHLEKQLKFVFVFALIQCPIAIYQRFVISAGHTTGDWVTGTLVNSACLSVFLLSVISVWLAFFLTGRLSARRFVLLALILFLPTTLNESKGTIVLLPFAVLLPVMFAPLAVNKFRYMLKMGLLGAGLLAVFVPIYDSFSPPKDSILEFYTSQRRLELYLVPKTSGRNPDNVGRLDGVILPIREASGDPMRLLFGLGMGNVNDSVLGDEFTGEYYAEYGEYVYGSLSLLLWEIGVLGSALMMLFCFLIFLDARRACGEGQEGAFALGWIGVTGLISISLFYSTIIAMDAIAYTFFYFSGYIAYIAAKKDRERVMSVQATKDTDVLPVLQRGGTISSGSLRARDRVEGQSR